MFRFIELFYTLFILAQLVYGAGSLMMASAGQAMATPDTFGPTVYQLSAEFWFLPLTFWPAVMLTGVALSLRWMRVLGSLGIATVYALLAGLAVQDGAFDPLNQCYWIGAAVLVFAIVDARKGLWQNQN